MSPPPPSPPPPVRRAGAGFGAPPPPQEQPRAMGGFVQRTKPSAGIGGGAEAGAQRDLDAVGHSMKSENRRIQEAQQPAAVTPTVSPKKSTFSYAHPPPPPADTVRAHRAGPEDLEAQDGSKKEKKGSPIKTLAIVLLVLLVLGAIGGGIAFLIINGKKAKAAAKKN